MPRVLNVRAQGVAQRIRQGEVIYVGRGKRPDLLPTGRPNQKGEAGHYPCGEFGNPFVIGRDGDRQQVIAKFVHHFINRSKAYQARALHVLQGKDLACHCAPEQCHAHWLITWANESTITC